MSETVSIQITIGNRSYPLKVKATEEVLFREAEKVVNQKWKAYESAFSVRDQQDLLAMCALQLATETIQLKNSVSAQQSSEKNEIDEILRLTESVNVL
jgi:cell division protein ZapA